MDIEETSIGSVKLLTPVKHGDSRGFFSETYNQQRLFDAGIDLNFVQDNHSLSGPAGTVRGLHFQAPPYAQDKLVRVLRGSIYDVAVDIRRGSPTFGEHVGVTLSADAWTQILVPMGFAHGFCTLEPDTEVIYKVSNYYAPDHDFGIHWQDPALAIDWPIGESAAILSDKDQLLPPLGEIEAPF